MLAALIGAAVVGAYTGCTTFGTGYDNRADAATACALDEDCYGTEPADDKWKLCGYDNDNPFGYRASCAQSCRCAEKGITPVLFSQGESNTLETCRLMCASIKCTHFTYTWGSEPTCTLHTVCTPEDNMQSKSRVFVPDPMHVAANGLVTKKCARTHVGDIDTKSVEILCAARHTPAVLPLRGKTNVNAWAVHDNKCYTLSNCGTVDGQADMTLFNGVEPLPYIRISTNKCGMAPATTQSVTTPEMCHQAALQQGAAGFNYDCTSGTCECSVYTSEFCTLLSIAPGGTVGDAHGYYLTSYPPKQVSDICYGFPILFVENTQSVADCVNRCSNHEWCAHVVFVTATFEECYLYTEDQCTRAFRAGSVSDLDGATYERYPRNWTDKSKLSAGAWVAIVTAIVAVVAIGATYAWAREAPVAQQFLMF